MASPKKGTRQPGFEEALARLEKIVKSLEDGDLPLEDSLRLFEEGVSLTRLCAARLEEAQKRIDVLTRNDQGDSKLVPFEPSRGEDEEGGPEAP
jgi:exodeoxyribonuclease VII small subunit